MAEKKSDIKIVGYKNIFGFVLPDWVDEKTIRLIVTFLLSASVMLFVLIFVVWPKFDDIGKLRSSLKSSKDSLVALKSSKKGFDQLSDQVPETNQTMILSAIPQSYSPENAVFLLRKIASETPNLTIVSYKLPSGVLFENTEVKNANAANGKEVVSFLNYPIRITVSAPVDSLLAFIRKIETSLPLGVLSDLGMQELSKLTTTSVASSVQMDLEIKYYQAVLKKVDISKIQPFTSADLSLVKVLNGYTRIGTVGVVTGDSVPTEISTSGLFGF